MIRITVTWWQGVYSGSDGDSRPEWPPSPYRVFAALLAGAHAGEDEQTDRERTALRRLSRCSAIRIWVPEHRSAVLPARFVPSTSMPAWTTGTTEPKLDKVLDSSLVFANHDTRSKAQVADIRTTLAAPDVHLDVEEEPFPLSDEDLSALRNAAARVPYVGRATHIADITIGRTDGTRPSPDHQRWGTQRAPNEPLRVWDDHTIDLLDQMHEDVFTTHTLPLNRASVAPRALPPATSPAARGDTWVAVRARRRLSPTRTPAVLRAAHQAIHAAWPHDEPSALIALPDVGHQRASGAILGVGLIGANEETVQRHAGALDIDVFDPAAPGRTVALQQWRWTRRSAAWASATPYVAHADERVARLELARDLEAHYGDDLEFEAQFSRRPRLPGEARWPEPPGGRQQWWVAISTRSPVPGPLVLGACRDDGYGLFLGGAS
ncbi:type I-U CRISPR-associated protein Csb2 [Cellulomonas sp. NPDC089187]|uniref:type I-G CRISPR-associated protein Csb2 n=1 Tax=Cellulomonas sp. NPDC089187 TaxID=3154970 RepID=UPI0034245C25